MLEKFIKRLCDELKLETVPPFDFREKSVVWSFDSRATLLQELDPGIAMQTHLAPCPTQKKEDLFVFLMKANALGAGTGNGRLGLDAEEKFLTLSLSLPYELDYEDFKQSIEIFLNFANYWTNEIFRFEQERMLT